MEEQQLKIGTPVSTENNKAPDVLGR